MRSNAEVECFKVEDLGKAFLCDLPCWQASQNQPEVEKSKESEIPIDLEPLNKSFMPVGERWPRRRCQSRNLSLETIKFKKSPEICEIGGIEFETIELSQLKVEV